MAGSSGLRQLLAAASLLLAGLASALPAEVHVVAHRELADVVPSPWVTVDASGDATTITPTITSVNGAVTTISPPPDALTKTGTYTLTPTGAAVTTSTGLPPVATASSSNGDGVFLACNVYQGVDAPFCQPQSGSQLSPGNTYYITWSDTYFSNTTTTVEIQGTYHHGSGAGFTSSRMQASTGFYTWTIASTLLTDLDPAVSSLNVSLTLAYFQDLYGNELQSITGPTVLITNTADTSTSDNKPSAAGIAVPVILVVVVLPLAGLGIWFCRRQGPPVSLVGALKRRSGQGYGVRQSRAQRVGAAVGGPGGDKKNGAVSGVELAERDSWGPAGDAVREGGRNVFREEVERQERER